MLQLNLLSNVILQSNPKVHSYLNVLQNLNQVPFIIPEYQSPSFLVFKNVFTYANWPAQGQEPRLTLPR